MKKLILILLSCSLSCLCTAQEKGYTLGVAAETGPVWGEGNVFSMQSFTLSPGYSFDGKWYMALPLNLTCELYKAGSMKGWQPAGNIGLSAGYNLLKNDRNLITFSAAVGGTVYAEAYKSLYYDLCAKWGTAARFKPLIGIGLRYYQSLGQGTTDRFCLYASIGFRFN